MPDDPTRGLVRNAGRARGRRAGRTDRRGVAADLPDQHVRPGWRREAAARLRVRAIPEPDSRATGASGRGARRRHDRDRLRVRVRDDRGHRRAGRARATRSSSATTSTAARSATSSGSTAATAWTPDTWTCQSGPDVLWEALTERTRLVWFETPSNPLPQGRGHRGGRRPPSLVAPPKVGERGRSSWWTTRSPRRPSSDP